MRTAAKWTIVVGAAWFACSILVGATGLFWNQIPDVLGVLIYFGYWLAGPALMMAGLFLLAIAGPPE